MALLFEDAAKAKNNIMASQQKEIAKLYDDWANDIADRAKFYSHKTTASAPLSERYYKELYKQMKATSKTVSDEVAGIIKSNMYTIADSVVADNVKWLQSFGFSPDGLNAAFSYVPHDVVQMLVTGQVYQSGWSLSQRIWSDNQQTQKDIYQIMARGLAEQKPIFNIAKDLESYVRPSAKKAWNPIIAMKNTKTGQIEYKRIYKKQVDYNAQRLARTLAQHTYQQSLIATTKNNPFITDYIWHSNGSRVCELCKTRDGAHFKKDELPMDHPNGMCVIEPAVVKDMVDQLADWFNSPDGTYPEIDSFAGNFGYEAKAVKSAQDFVNKYGMSTKSPNAWFNSLTQIQKAEAKALKDASGLTWNQWYEQNVHANSNSAATETTQTVKAFKSAQEKYLAKYGFTPQNVPNVNEWANACSKEDALAILKSLGTDFSDPKATSKLYGFYYDNLASDKLTTKTVKVANKVDDAAIAFKTKYTQEQLSDIAHKAYMGNKDAVKTMDEFLKISGIDSSKFKDKWGDYNNPYDSKLYGEIESFFIKHTKSADKSDVSSWIASFKKQTESHMLDLEKESMKLIGAAGKSGIKTYSGSAYDAMNGYLRLLQQGYSEADAIDRSGISPSRLEAVKNAMAGLNNAKLTEDLVLRRGTDLGDLAGAFMSGDFRTNKNSLQGKSAKELNEMFAGAIGQYGSFTSTSSIWDRGFSGNVEVVLYAPTGTSASSIMSISQFGTSEGETLLNAGTIVKCTKIEESDGHKGSSIRVFMEIIPK